MAIGILILTPLVAALLTYCIRRNTRSIEAIASVAAVIEAAVAVVMTARTVQHSPFYSTNYFQVDSLSALLVLLTSIVALGTVFYSIGYLREEVKKNIIGFHRVRQFYTLMHLFLLSLFVLMTTASPLLTWIAIEATTLSTAFLISFYNKPTAMEAAWKYLIINSVALLLGFLGIVLFYGAVTPFAEGSAVTWSSLSEFIVNVDPTIAKIAFILVFIGFGTKMGIVPMHTWKPDAYSKAPIPIVALFSSGLLNAAFSAILRFQHVTNEVAGSGFTHSVFIFFGTLSIVVVAFIILAKKNYKRLLAYSSIEHGGLMLLGVGFGGFALFAAMLHMVYHSLVKSFFFLVSGNVFLKYSTTQTEKVRGAMSLIPLSSVFFIIGAVAVTGMPPFGLFLSEWYMLSTGAAQYPVIVAVVIIALILVFVGFFKDVTTMLFGEAPSELKPGESSVWTVVPPVLFIVLFSVISVYIPEFLSTLLHNAAALK